MGGESSRGPGRWGDRGQLADSDPTPLDTDILAPGRFRGSC